MKSAMYLRKSRAEEVSDTTEETLLRHKETLLKFASKNNIIVSNIYEEVVSGESLYARPQMLKLLEDIEKGLYEAVLCMDIDRLGRGAMSDQGIILEAFKNSNTKIITPRKIYDLNNELDEEYTEFETFMARRELKLIKRRMQRGIKKTIEDGGYIANPPFGYDKIYINKKPTLAINEKEAHYVQMAYDMYVNQGLGAQIIANTFNNYGIKPKRGNQFSRNTVRFILSNPVYIGKIVWDRKTHIRKGAKGNEKHITIYNPEEKWSITDGVHPAIISTELFEKAQEIRKNRYHPPYWTGALENPLAGVIICRECGMNIQRRPYKNRKIPDYLMCGTKSCVKASRFDRVEKALLDGLSAKLDELKVSRETAPANDIPDIKKTLALVEKEIKTVEQQKDKLHDFLEQGVYTVDVFMKRLQTLDEKINNLSESRIELEEKLLKITSSSIDILIPKIENVLAAYQTATNQEKNILLKSIIKDVTYYKDKSWGAEQFELDIHLKGV